MAHRVFITGAAGYIGGMLCDLLSRRDDVDRIIALDKEPMPALLHGNRKIRWIDANTADASWNASVAAELPDLVIHAAWQIREMYGNTVLQRRWNVVGSDRVFDFAFGTASVQRLLHFSTIAAYGAQADNTVAHRFRETDGFRPSDHRYAEEKRIVEAQLAGKFAQARDHGSAVSVVVIRPAAVSGPRGRRRRNGLGLQSALSGQVKGSASLLFSLIPVTPHGSRQFLHEDDLADIVALLAFGALKSRYEVLNACPQGDAVRGGDLARAFGKRAITIHPQLIRLAFFLAWHATRGRIPTPRGAWKSYSYPLLVDGSTLTQVYGYRYRVGSMDAFTKDVGRYAERTA